MRGEEGDKALDWFTMFACKNNSSSLEKTEESVSGRIAMVAPQAQES